MEERAGEGEVSVNVMDHNLEDRYIAREYVCGCVLTGKVAAENRKCPLHDEPTMYTYERNTSPGFPTGTTGWGGD